MVEWWLCEWHCGLEAYIAFIWSLHDEKILDKKNKDFVIVIFFCCLKANPIRISIANYKYSICNINT